MKENTINIKTWLPHALALSFAVVVYVVLTHLPAIWSGIRYFYYLFSPVFLAAVIAYLVNPLATFFRRRLFCCIRSEKRKRILSNTMAFATVILFLFMTLLILIPQLIEGVSAFVANLDVYMEKARTSLPNLNFFGNALNLPGFLESRDKLLDTLAQMLRKNADKILATSALAGISLFQWLVSLFLSMYLLAGKEQLRNGFRRLMQACLSEQQFETMTRFLHRCNSILNRYVVYNLLDSLIIGGANTVFMALMGMPYIGFVSFVEAITNLIPTFGPIIGAVIGALILSLVELRFAIAFLVFTTVLQLSDGYLIKPKLFGSSLGVSSLWVLIGVIVGGRMIGVAGVLLAIPAVAIFDYLYKDYLLPHMDVKKTTVI